MAVSLQLAAVMSVVIAIVTSMFCSDILQMMQTPENILRCLSLFADYFYRGALYLFLIICFQVLFVHWVIARLRFGLLLFSTILNILLDLFCILILDWGVAGAAVATVFSQGVSAVLCYLYMMRHF